MGVLATQQRLPRIDTLLGAEAWDIATDPPVRLLGAGKRNHRYSASHRKDGSHKSPILFQVCINVLLQ